MREAYRRSQDYLQTTKAEIGEEKIKEAFKKQLLAVAGFKEEEIAKYDLASMTDEELHSLVRQRLLGVMANNGNRQRVIPLSDVEKYLGEGWEYVTALPNERAIVKIEWPADLDVVQRYLRVSDKIASRLAKVDRGEFYVAGDFAAKEGFVKVWPVATD